MKSENILVAIEAYTRIEQTTDNAIWALPGKFERELENGIPEDRINYNMIKKIYNYIIEKIYRLQKLLVTELHTKFGITIYDILGIR